MKKIMTPFVATLIAACFLNACTSKPEKASITIYCTTDVHGTLFDYDLKRDSECRTSMANVSAYLKAARQQDSTGIILLDAGDILQGQPSTYYSNFIDTTHTHIAAQVLNALQYDAAAVGNHDIEAGHPVYDRVVKEFQFPWLSANTLDSETGEPYFQPYTIIHRNGIKIAILGMTTPGIPKWLPEYLWNGLEFEDMIETAQLWVPRIQQKEKPDILIGLFHSGFDYNYAGENADTPRNENAGVLVAQQVDGFDIVILGHDHQEKIEEITNNAGHKVIIIDPKSHASMLGKITVDLTMKNGKYEKTFTPELIDLANTSKDTDYIAQFTPALNTMKEFINTPLGEFANPLSGREGLFGPSAFSDFIHTVQLATTEADISFCSVLQMDAQINKGTITMRDMFNLYNYENGLYIMQFTGNEVDTYLEYAYALQYNTMKSENDHLLKFQTDDSGQLTKNKRGKYILANPFFNYSCAAGIKYTVDVSQPEGERVVILSMTDGTPFYNDSTYTVAINSYRANGGGGHLTQGLGWSKGDIDDKTIAIKEQDIRHYITNYISTHKSLNPVCRNDWKVMPEKWFTKGKQLDYNLMYESH